MIGTPRLVEQSSLDNKWFYGWKPSLGRNELWFVAQYSPLIYTDSVLQSRETQRRQVTVQLNASSSSSILIMKL